MMQSVQLAIADGQYATTVREALTRSCACHVESVNRPDPACLGVLVLDEQAFARLPLPLSNPGRIVLISHKEPQTSEILAQAWEAGIVSVVFEEDPLNTVLLAIMAAALRVPKPPTSNEPSEITPSSASKPAPISPAKSHLREKRCKNQ